MVVLTSLGLWQGCARARRLCRPAGSSLLQVRAFCRFLGAVGSCEVSLFRHLLLFLGLPSAQSDLSLCTVINQMERNLKGGGGEEWRQEVRLEGW